jgi:hypothetical protein
MIARCRSLRSSNLVAVLASLAAMLVLASRPGRAAEILQRADVEFKENGLTIAHDPQSTTDAGGGTLVGITSEINGAVYSGIAAVGALRGDFGVLLELTPRSASDEIELSSQVDIFGLNLFENPFSFPVRVKSNFIIDGGRLKLVLGHEASYTISLKRVDPSDPENSATSELKFFSGGKLTPDEATLFTTSGVDIGAAVIDSGIVNEVDIPLSGQSADLGILAPGEKLSLRYTFEMGMTMFGGEFGQSKFSDPFSLSGEPIFGTLSVEPLAVASVPEPSSFGLSLFGLGALSLIRVVRRRLAIA